MAVRLLGADLGLEVVQAGRSAWFWEVADHFTRRILIGLLLSIHATKLAGEPKNGAGVPRTEDCRDVSD